MVLYFVCLIILALSRVVLAEPLRFAVTDIVGLEDLQREFRAFQDKLSEKLGQPVKLFPVSGRTVVVEALKSKKLDLVLTGPAEYVMIRKKTEAVPLVGFARPDYYSVIVVLSESKIHTVKDLKGKKVAFGDVGSTSYHLAPMKLLADAGLDPRRDIQALHVNPHVGWEALKRGDVDAMGMNHQRFLEWRAKEKKLPAGAFRVIARGPDLPNDVLIAGKHLSLELRKKIKKVFVQNSDELIKAVLVGKRNNKYRGMRFIGDISDSDYDYIRSMYTAAGFGEFGKESNSG
ncbi:MAG: phosphate/phosphite/phosphonate ABC transporter substrate-binding protein [Candidatus Dadabacteria bacterium]|nr:MAG: phosphate/phosphite/phosphonate ABC transporter substrate-binding protein [Candidatus Dadabacteria bacterium]